MPTPPSADSPFHAEPSPTETPLAAWAGEESALPRILSEDECLALINDLFPLRADHLLMGRGDDCAVLARPQGPLAVSTDMFLEDVHFRTAYFTPEEAGAKALSTAVSDLAAAGAVPQSFSLGLMIPEGMSKSALQAVLVGMARKARGFNIVLSGGDISRSAALGFSITVWGARPGPDVEFLARGTAKPGDCVFLIGDSGLAAVGFDLLETEGRSAALTHPASVKAHLDPQIFLAEGQALARLGALHRDQRHRLALMDLSDGLARDLPRLLGGLGADLSFDIRVVASEATAEAEQRGLAPEHIFLSGGEDYSLIGSCAERFWPLLQQTVPGVRLLGRVTSQPGLTRHGLPVDISGFDHFASQKRRAGGVPGQWLSLETSFSGRRSGDHRSAKTPALDAAGKLIIMCRKAWESGMMQGFCGNASVRLSQSVEGTENTDVCLITRSACPKNLLTEHDFALLRVKDGEHLAGPAPSSEFPLHLAVYSANPKVKVVLHFHPPHLQALSLRHPQAESFDLPLFGASMFIPRLAFVSDLPSGSPELAAAVAGCAGEYDAVWVERHGLITFGKDLVEAFAFAEELEILAKVRLLAER